MRVVANAEAVRLIQDRGGALYVWTDTHRCCSGGITYLKTGSAAKEGRRFERVESQDFELWFAPGSHTPPDELHLDVKGSRNKRVEAYWNGCVFAI